MEIAQKGKYLTYSLSREEYGIDISKIREIKNITEKTGIILEIKEELHTFNSRIRLSAKQNKNQPAEAKNT